MWNMKYFKINCGYHSKDLRPSISSVKIISEMESLKNIVLHFSDSSEESVVKFTISYSSWEKKSLIMIWIVRSYERSLFVILVWEMVAISIIRFSRCFDWRGSILLKELNNFGNFFVEYCITVIKFFRREST